MQYSQNQSTALQIIKLALPIAFGLLLQTLYFLVDLYFVSKISTDAVVGVGAGGNVAMLLLAATQALGAGTVALVSQAAGRKDAPALTAAFRQSLLLSLTLTAASLLALFLFSDAYLRTISESQGARDAGANYLLWFAPGLSLQFVIVSLTSALRGLGIVKPPMVFQLITILINIALAPVLISGWGTHVPLGVVGAGLASTLAIFVGLALLLSYAMKSELGKSTAAIWKPDFLVWGRLVVIGAPVGGEFIFIFLTTAVIYWATRDFGAEAQAGFGIGYRLMQSLFLPAMAVSFAVAPIAGQNLGAGHMNRVRQTFYSAVIVNTAVMLAILLIAQTASDKAVLGFAKNGETAHVAAIFLTMVSWSFPFLGVTFVCSGMFQGLGNTMPALLSSALRFSLFTVLCSILKTWADFRIEQIWKCLIFASIVQTGASVLLLILATRERSRSAATNAALPQTEL